MQFHYTDKIFLNISKDILLISKSNPLSTLCNYYFAMRLKGSKLDYYLSFTSFQGASDRLRQSRISLLTSLLFPLSSYSILGKICQMLRDSLLLTPYSLLHSSLFSPLISPIHSLNSSHRLVF